VLQAFQGLVSQNATSLALQAVQKFCQSTRPVTLLEAVDMVDAGPIYAQDHFVVNATDLVSQWRGRLAKSTVKLVKNFVADFPESLKTARLQIGEPTYYPRRRPKDSELDFDKTLRQQFNLFQVVDNDHYPAYFSHNGQEFLLKIFPRHSIKNQL
jgi:methionyl-tRNA formyltransferase